MISLQHSILKEVHGVGKKRLDGIITNLESNNQTINDLFQMTAPEIKAKFKLPINVAEAIVQAGIQANVVKDDAILALTPRLTKTVTCLTNTDTNYPSKLAKALGSKSPNVLYMWGNLSLLDLPSVGFCGSRNVSEKGLQVTADAVEQIVQLGWVVVSGHAKGVDTTAHRTALENDGCTIIVAAEGIEVFKLRQELKKIAKPEQILIVSEFEPKARWVVGRAMQRNTTIIGLSNAMVLIESRLEGGTYEAGKTALRLKMPLFVAQYEMEAETNAGNAYFLQHGAIPFMKNKVTGRANIDVLREVVMKMPPSETLELMLPGFER